MQSYIQFIGIVNPITYRNLKIFGRLIGGFAWLLGGDGSSFSSVNFFGN